MPVFLSPSSGGGGGTLTARSGRTLWGPGAMLGANSSGTTTAATLNDADNAVATVLIARKAGSLTDIGLYCDATEASTGNLTGRLNVGFTTVDSSGNPTQTAFGGAAPNTTQVWADGWLWITVPTPATVAVGDILAAHVWPVSGNTPDGTNFVAINQQNSYSGGAGIPYSAAFTTTWSKSTNLPLICARYSDGTIIGGAPLNLAAGSTALNDSIINTGTTPDEVGCLFSLPFAAKCSGARVIQDPSGTGSTWTVKLYLAADNTLLGSWTNGNAAKRGGVAIGSDDAYWADADLAVATNYRITVLPTAATSVALWQATVPDVGSRAWWPEGSRWQRTERKSAGSWTDTTTKLPLFALWLSEITA